MILDIAIPVTSSLIAIINSYLEWNRNDAIVAMLLSGAKHYNISKTFFATECWKVSRIEIQKWTVELEHVKSEMLEKWDIPVVVSVAGYGFANIFNIFYGDLWEWVQMLDDVGTDYTYSLRDQLFIDLNEWIEQHTIILLPFES